MSIQTTRHIPVAHLGRRLAMSLEDAGMTAEDMAAVLECSPGTVRNYIARRTPISKADAYLWAEATGVPREWLWLGIESDGPNGGGVTPPLVRARSRSAQHALAPAA